MLLLFLRFAPAAAIENCVPQISQQYLTIYRFLRDAPRRFASFLLQGPALRFFIARCINEDFSTEKGTFYKMIRTAYIYAFVL
jgi:hypothetical protein